MSVQLADFCISTFPKDTFSTPCIREREIFFFLNQNQQKEDNNEEKSVQNKMKYLLYNNENWHLIVTKITVKRTRFNPRFRRNNSSQVTSVDQI